METKRFSVLLMNALIAGGSLSVLFLVELVESEEAMKSLMPWVSLMLSYGLVSVVLDLTQSD